MLGSASMQRHELERLSREELIAHAERLNVPRPRVLTQPELIDEIIARTARTDKERARSRGWLGKARDLLARVVEQGLHLPDAARAIRAPAAAGRTWPTPPPPLPTVTLAEIYAAQGHLERAVAVLDEVIAREPDHKEARELRERFVEQTQRTRARPSRATDAAAGRAEAKEPAEVEEPAEADAKEPAQADAKEPAAAVAFAAEESESAAGAEEVSTTGAEETNTSGLMEAEAINAAALAAAEEVSTTGVEEATTSGMVEAENGQETGAEAAEEVSTTGAEGASTPGGVEAEQVEASSPEKVEEVSPTGAEEANTSGVVEADEVSAAVTPEAAPEEAAAAADAEGTGPATERDAGAPVVVEASPDEGAAGAEGAKDAREEAEAREERDEIEQTVVDGGAIADLVERLKADEEPKEEELPEGYDVDEVVAIAVDPETIYVYWEVRAVTLARALSRRPGGRLALRIAAVTASWDGPVTRTWDLHVDALYGDRFVRDIPQGANVRVSVGWLEGAAFEPFAVGAEVASPRLAPADVEATEMGRWESDPSAASPVPLGRAPRGYGAPAHQSPSAHGYGGGGAGQRGGGAGDANAAAAAASPVALGGRPAQALTALAPRGGGGPGIDRATRSEELTRSYFRSVAGSYLRGGASDLVRGGASERVRGGASELAWGGASDLMRARNI